MRHGKNNARDRPGPTLTWKRQRLLAGIREIHRQYQMGGDPQRLFAGLLDVALEITGSLYGTAGEVVRDPEGELRFKPLASRFANDASPKKYAAFLKQVITSGRACFAQVPAPGKRRRDAARTFPDTYLGLPIYNGKTLVGAVCAAHNADGYDEQIGAFLEPLLSSFGTLVQFQRNELLRNDAERMLREELAQREHVEAALREIAATVSSSTGAEFFDALVKQLSKVLDVDAVFISVIHNDKADTANIIAFCDRGAMQDNFRYPFAATPCENIVAEGPLYYLSGLRKKFPRGTMIKEYGWDSCLGVPLRDVSGAVLGVITIADRKPIAHRQPAEDILQICASRVAAELVHQRAEERMCKLSQALEHTADSITITDPSGTIEYVNPAFSTMTGYSVNEALGHNPNIVKSGRHDAQFYRQLWDCLLKGQVFRDVFVNRKKGGEFYYEEKTITPLKDAQGQITHFISTGKDITERLQTQERLHYLSYHDVLTELPNRLLFLEWLNHALAGDKNGSTRVAVICLDVDRFKIINDTLGHNIGDRVLLALSQLLKSCVSMGNAVARLGGDEFAILKHFASPTEVMTKINEILETVAQPLRIDDHELYITISIGIALSPEDGADANTLLRNADTALYRAKEQGRHSYHFYSAELSHKASKRLNLETNLYRATERQEFHLCYQPQVDLTSGRTMGLEALLRWRHPELGLIDPLDFIPLLEDTGLIIPVGEWVLRTACAEAARWHDLSASPLRLSVNLSGRQFNDPSLHKTVGTILAESGLCPSQLELEITESVLMQNDQAFGSNLDALQCLGVRIAIDDFGTGYSSLSYLKRFPVDTLKIDRSFIRDVMHSPDDKTIIKAIIAMARSLKVNIIAEGVETVDQLQFLRSNGCHTAQGFLLGEPLAASGLSRFLEQPLALA